MNLGNAMCFAMKLHTVSSWIVRCGSNFTNSGILNAILSHHFWYFLDRTIGELQLQAYDVSVDKWVRVVFDEFCEFLPIRYQAWILAGILFNFHRIPAGAALAAGDGPGLDISSGAEFAALLVGGGVAATSHTAKAGSRMLINTSPEPISSWSASIAGDIAVVGGLWASLQFPWIFVAGLVLFLLLVAWLLPESTETGPLCSA